MMRITFWRCPLSSLVVLFGLLSVTACAPNAEKVFAPLDEIKGYTPVHQQYDYRIGIGDELEIKFFFAPELNERLTVTPDGTISLMFAPHIQAAGQTVQQLTEELKLVLEDHVKQLDMSIVVSTFSSQRVVVAGEIAKPGAVQLMGMETVMQVLGEAGWLTPNAGQDKVVLLRRNQDNIERAYNVDISKIIDTSDMSQNVVVEAGDVIMVPPSDAVEVGRWVGQHIRDILPLSTTAGISYNINNRWNSNQ